MYLTNCLLVIITSSKLTALENRFDDEVFDSIYVDSDSLLVSPLDEISSDEFCTTILELSESLVAVVDINIILFSVPFHKNTSLEYSWHDERNTK